MFVGYFVHIHTIDKVKCRVFILTQLNINQRQRLWALMDTHTRQPLLYPLIYLIDHLALRSSATQSASLQALKFFYEFWHQKHGVTFCFSFYSSNHNPLIAIDELTAFFHYLENTHLYVPALTIRSTTQTTPQRCTNIRHVHSVIRFIRYLINTYISPRYIDGTPKELTRLATQLTGRLSIHNIPVSIYLKSADHFDDKYISSTSDSWVFDYSGSRCYAHFRQDKISNQLIKYICFHYASAKCPAQVPGVLHAWSLATDHCISKSAFTFTVLKDYLETQEIKPQYFYFIIFGLKILCTEAFPGFTLEDYEDLEFIPRPHSHDWGIYQEIDHVLDPLEKNMISKGLFEMAVAIRYGENYSLNTMRDAVILGLTYVTGARPVQLAKLAVKDLRIDTRNSETGLIRYSLLLPYAKQRHVTTERLFLAIPAEIGALIRHYIERAQLKPDGKLFEFSNSAPFNVSRAINKAFLCFSPPDYQAAVKRGEAALPTITPTDLRHNVGHSLAMQGVSAEEIAHILGHSSLTVAKYYILATPALALIRAKALGINPVWQNMVAMMLTGELTSSTKWQDQRVVGIIGDELHDGIGGCSRDDGKCPFSEVRCCYGCLYFRPFTDGDHQAVLESVVKEVDELISISDSVGNARNPLISIHETTQFEIQSVIARCRFHQEKGGVR